MIATDIIEENNSIMDLITSLIKSIFGLDSPDYIGKTGEDLTARKLGWI